jgi:hypothetical protein
MSWRPFGNMEHAVRAAWSVHLHTRFHLAILHCVLGTRSNVAFFYFILESMPTIKWASGVHLGARQAYRRTAKTRRVNVLLNFKKSFLKCQQTVWSIYFLFTCLSLPEQFLLKKRRHDGQHNGVTERHSASSVVMLNVIELIVASPGERYLLKKVKKRSFAK